MQEMYYQILVNLASFEYIILLNFKSGKLEGLIASYKLMNQNLYYKIDSVLKVKFYLK